MEGKGLYSRIKPHVADRAFYKHAFAVMAPIMFQQLITTLVNLVDNLQVGQLGPQSIAGVGIANQFFFIYMLMLFGIAGGGGLYVAQFWGAKDGDGMKQAYRFMLIASLAVSITFMLGAFFGARWIIGFFTNDAGTISEGVDYLKVAVFTYIPMAFSVATAGSFRSIGQAKVAMLPSIVAVFVNTFFNYVFIFGNFGAPRMGVRGAALATIIARLVELAMLYYAMSKETCPFGTRLARVFNVRPVLFKTILVKSLPLIANELLWSSGVTMQFKAYSTRGVVALAALNIMNAVNNMFFVVNSGQATSISVIIGHALGANQLDDARRDSRRLILFGIFISYCLLLVHLAAGYLVPMIYNVGDDVRTTARIITSISAFMMPVYLTNAGFFFILRAGGDTRSVMTMDSLFTWFVVVPFSLALAHFTDLSLIQLFLMVQIPEFLKLSIAFTLFRKERWVKNLTGVA
ncbi:MAG TPA: MATE family efflux transporter [Bacillota bacterium]|nr:MATE family efflux transporter [Bacillota bacterium]HOA15035.1 MATE family efflux transporter [Bacillota bacterium]